jgi:hypothetical protein
MVVKKNIIKRISELKKDVVFVGGLSLIHHNMKDTTKDIDMVVLNLDGLEEFGPFEIHNLPSEISTTRSIAKTYVNGILLDIIIDNKLPEYVESNGIKFATITDMIKFYEERLPKVSGNTKMKLQSTYDLIKEKINH